MPWASSSEYETAAAGKTRSVWFAFGEERPPADFAGGIRARRMPVREAKEGEVTADIFAF